MQDLGLEASTGESRSEGQSTQNTQYDAIGERYLKIKELPAVEAEMPSVLSVLGREGLRGKKCLGMCLSVVWFVYRDVR